MQYFDPSEDGEPGKRIETVPKFPQRKLAAPSPDRSTEQWQPLGAVVRRVVARLMVDQDGQP